jgi:hypothetical protein
LEAVLHWSFKENVGDFCPWFVRKNEMKKPFFFSSMAILLAVILLPAQAFAQCGGERWAVKIGTDSTVSQVKLSSPKSTTISSLAAISKPSSLPDTKRISPTETTVWVVHATLKKYIKAFDNDYHMVLADDAGRTMIAEIPDPNCATSGPLAAGIAHARSQFNAVFTPTGNFQTANVPVQVTGVGFFDYLEGQAGQAPNGIELHPVIDITFDANFSLSSSPSALSVAQGGSGTANIVSTLSGVFNSSVSLSVSGLPSGTIATLNPTTIPTPGSGSSTLTFNVGASTPVGTYNVVVTGTGGGQSHTTTASLTVTAGTGGSSQLIGNPGFENGSSNPAPWNVSDGVIDNNSSSEPPRTGSWKAWLDGYGFSHTDTLWQQVSIPSTATQATLSFWLHIDTAETTTTSANDTMNVQVRDSNGAVLTTLASYSNLNAAAGYSQVIFDLSAYQGQTIQIYFVGVENGSLKTSFVLDDFALVTSSGGSTGDFTIAASPNSLSVAQGNSGTSTITTTTSGSFNSAVALSATGLPSGATAVPSPTSIAAPGSGASTLTLSVGSSTVPGNYTVMVTGSGGGQTHSTMLALTVTSSGGGGGGTTQQLLGNTGFENGSSNAGPWTVTSGVIDNNSTSEPAHSGLWKAWLDGYGAVHTDSIYQSVSLPATATQATLTFWLHIDTAETTTSTAYDTLKVQVRNSSGTVLATLATYSNLDAKTGYTQVTFDLSAYAGQNIQVYLVGTEDASLKTSFVVDDFALNVTTP